MLGDDADGYTTALRGLHHELLVDEVNVEERSNPGAHFTSAAGGPADEGDYWHLSTCFRPARRVQSV